MSYRYIVYGLRVLSEIEIPKLRVWQETDSEKEQLIGEQTVLIKYGNIRDDVVVHMQKTGIREMLKKDEVILYYEKEAVFAIIKGNQIIVQLFVSYQPEHIRALLLSNCLGVIMVQRGIVAIHGGAVVHKKKAIVVTGSSGSGKSTLCQYLREQGMGFLADDTVAVATRGERTIAYPGYPYTKLCKDAALKYGYDLSQLEFLWEDKEKYAIPFWDTFCKVPVELKAIVMVCPSECENVTIRQISGSAKIQFFVDSLYCYKIYQALGLDAELFQNMLKIVSSISCYVIERPVNGMTVDMQYCLLMDRLEEKMLCGRK